MSRLKNTYFKSTKTTKLETRKIIIFRALMNNIEQWTVITVSWVPKMRLLY